MAPAKRPYQLTGQAPHLYTTRLPKCAHLGGEKTGVIEDVMTAATQIPHWSVDYYKTLENKPLEGLRLLNLLVNADRWVHRRIESVTFHDDRSVSRRVSVDFTVPRDAPRLTINGCETLLIPLTTLRKKTLVHFDLRDEQGAPIPLLGLRQTQALTMVMMASWAKFLLGLPLGQPLECEDLDGMLQSVATGTQDELDAALKRFCHSDPRRSPMTTRLHCDPKFRVILYRMSDNFTLLTPVSPSDEMRRRIIKFSYDEPLSMKRKGLVDRRWRVAPWYQGLPSRVSGALGWSATTIRFPTPSSEHCQSYHFEVEAPSGTRIKEATLLADRLEKPEQDGERRYVSFDRVGGGFPRANVHVADVPSGSVSYALVSLRASVDGWLTTSLYICWATAAVLGAVYFITANRGAQSNFDLATSVFATVTGGVVSLAARPGHRMAGRLLRGARTITTLLGVLPFVAAALLLAPGTEIGDLRLQILGGLTGAACVMALVVTGSWLRSRKSSTDAISVWEQGFAVSGLGKPARYETYAEAERREGYRKPSIIVASSEGERAPGREDTDAWNNGLDGELREAVEAAMRTLPSRRLARTIITIRGLWSLYQ
jgi:hypothetical protein